MRSILLASAAIIISTGAAFAQMSPSPAPTGAPGAPVMTSPGASPGNTAPPPSGPNAPMSSPENTGVGGGTTASAPAPTGAPQAAQVTQPGASPGNMAPSTTPSNTADMTPPVNEPAMKMSASTGMPHPMMHHAMTMPEDADAGTYLHIAKVALKHDDKMVADDALSHAETRLLTRSVPQSGTIPTDDSPAVTSIEHARMAIGSGDLSTASSDTSMAISQVSSGM